MADNPTGTRKPSTQPLTAPPELALPPPARAAALPRWWRWALIAAVVLLAGGGALLLLRSADPRADTRPIAVVKGFAAAIEARDADTMLGYVEPTIFRREISPEVRAYVEYLEQVQFADARYELLDNDGERAHVRWVATMRYTLNLGDERKSGERPIDTTFELVMFEGSWYLRSAKLPN